jgi:Holliday junction resolvase RusA-like endonuclease
MILDFFVPGTPIPKGSAKAFVVKGKNGGKPRAIVTQDNGDKQKPWASAISYTAMQEMSFQKPVAGPVYLTLHFTMPRVKSHFGTGKNATVLKNDAPYWHTSKPDLDKLIRCVKDALTGIVWNDDSQVCFIVSASKRYCKRPGVRIKVEGGTNVPQAKANP